MSSSLLNFLLAASYMVVGVDAYAKGVGSCVAGFDKFPVGSEHNWQNSTRPGGLLADNYGDVAFSGMTLTLGDTELQKPSGSDQFHYTGECDADYLCGKCQGGCTDDAGCEEGLECFIRSADEAVPGCSGTVGLWDEVSYCYDPTATSTTRQGQVAQVAATFEAGTYTLKLEAPAITPFKGFLFRLEDEDGQDLSGAIEMVTDNMQVLESTGQMDGNGINVMATCAPNVAAVSHIDGDEKALAEAVITVPQAGKASLEVTVMVGEHEWYLTNYMLQFEGQAAAPTAPANTPTEPPVDDSPTDAPPTDAPPTSSPPPTESSEAMEGETSGTGQTVLSLFAAVTLVGLGLALC